MAGLPCEVCQEEALVIPSAQIVEDATGRMVYRRYRTCTNPDCELYLVRRETVEVFTPLTQDAPILRPYLHNIRQRSGGADLPRRTAPFPIDLVPEHLRRSSLSSQEIAVVEMARQTGQIELEDVQEQFNIPAVKARKLLDSLTALGVLTYSPDSRYFLPVPDDEIPEQVILPHNLQRNAS